MNNIDEILQQMNLSELLNVQNSINGEIKRRNENNYSNNLIERFRYLAIIRNKEALINLMRNNYSDCYYHSVIQLNQQYYNENQAEKIFKYFLTNYYQLYYGKHVQLAKKPQMKYLTVVENGKDKRTTHFHVLHNPLRERFNEDVLIQQANNFLVLANNTVNHHTDLGIDDACSKQLVEEYIRFNTNAIMTKAIKKVMKNANVDTKFISDKYHFDNLCDYFSKELNENNFIYYTEDYFLKSDKYNISEQEQIAA